MKKFVFALCLITCLSTNSYSSNLLYEGDEANTKMAAPTCKAFEDPTKVCADKSKLILINANTLGVEYPFYICRHIFPYETQDELSSMDILYAHPLHNYNGAAKMAANFVMLEMKFHPEYQQHVWVQACKRGLGVDTVYCRYDLLPAYAPMGYLAKGDSEEAQRKRAISDVYIEIVGAIGWRNHTTSLKLC